MTGGKIPGNYPPGPQDDDTKKGSGDAAPVNGAMAAAMERAKKRPDDIWKARRDGLGSFEETIRKAVKRANDGTVPAEFAAELVDRIKELNTALKNKDEVAFND